MKFNKWTVGLATVGVISLASAARADEQMSMVQTALSQTTLSGYVDTAAQWNPGTDQRPTPPVGVESVNIPKYAFAKNDGFSLNAVDIALDKPEDSSQWAAGYHVEVMAGSDSVGVGVSGALSLRQAFVRLHTPLAGNGIDWEIGVFDSIIGYESNSDPLNPNYTRSYGYTIEPTTMTGILGTYKINDDISISGGIADVDGGLGTIPPTFGSPGTMTTYESQKTYLGSVTFTAPDSMGFMKGATASAGIIHGTDSYQYGNGTENNLYAGLTMPTPINQLKLGAAFDYLWEPNYNTPPFPTSNANDNIWVAGVYGTYQASDKMSVNVRGEIGYDSSSATDIVSLYPGGGVFDEITVTLQYNLWANVMTRGEFRWDHVTHGNWFGAANDSSPTPGAPDRNSDFLLALNVIYQF